MSNVIDMKNYKDPRDTICTHLVAEYTTTLEWDLEDKGIFIEDIYNYNIKWGCLHITFKDGTTAEYDNSEYGDTDYKWADKETFYNDQYDKIKVDL